MKLSIIIPVYNAGKFLQACLESIYRQGLAEEEFEVLAINDGSTDDSGKLLDAACREHTNMRVFHEPNSGVSATRNKGLNRASGDYILFLDSDDLLADGSLPGMLRLAYGHETEIVKGMHTELQDEALQEMGNAMAFSEETAPAELLEDPSRMLAGLDPRNGFCYLYLFRRDFLDRHRLRFSEESRFMEDLAFIVQAICRTRRFLQTGIRHYVYRLHAASCVHSIDTAKLHSAITALGIIDAELPAAPTECRTQLIRILDFNLRMIVWFAAHYRSIYPDRSRICRHLRQALRNLPATPRHPRLLLLRWHFPLIQLQHRLARRRY